MWLSRFADGFGPIMAIIQAHNDGLFSPISGLKLPLLFLRYSQFPFHAVPPGIVEGVFLNLWQIIFIRNIISTPCSLSLGTNSVRWEPLSGPTTTLLTFLSTKLQFRKPANTHFSYTDELNLDHFRLLIILVFRNLFRAVPPVIV
jgi:hypothetical protein